jgi:hypothetical protein
VVFSSPPAQVLSRLGIDRADTLGGIPHIYRCGVKPAQFLNAIAALNAAHVLRTFFERSHGRATERGPNVGPLQPGQTDVTMEI